MVTWFTFKKLIGINDFSFQFRKITTRYKHIGNNLNVMRQGFNWCFSQFAPGFSKLFGAQGSPSSGSLLNLLSPRF